MLSRSQRERLVRKLNEPATAIDPATWLDEEDEFDLIDERLSGIEDALSDIRNMLLKVLDGQVNRRP